MFAFMEECAVIYVDEDHASQVEYLLEQASRGNHVLFDTDFIRRVFQNPRAPLSQEEAYEVEHHIERLIEIPTLVAKRRYLDGLAPELQESVMLTYFNIIENNLYESRPVIH